MRKKETQTVLKWDLLKTAIINQMIIVLVIFVTLGFLMSTFMIAQIKQNSEILVKSVNLNVRELFEHSSQNLDEIYHLYYQETVGDASHRSRIFNIFRNSESTIEGIMILNGKGVLVDGSTNGQLVVGTDYSNQSFVKEVPKIGDIHWSGVTVAKETNEPVAYVSKRFEQYIVVIRFNLTSISDYISQFKLSKGSEIALTDGSGIYLINQDPALVSSRSYDAYIRSGSKGTLAEYKGKYYLPYVSQLQNQGWIIVIYQSLDDYLQPTILMLSAFLLVTILLIFLVNALNYKALGDITSDLSLLEQRALEISKGDYNFKAVVSRYIEINMLSESFAILIDNIKARETDIECQNDHIMRLNEGLEKQVRQRTEQLENANSELTDAYDHLKEAQDLIVQNEKLAALGQMVSGVAHELNTPIGNAYTASTYMRGVAKDLNEKTQGNLLKKSEFLEMVSELDNGADIVVRNLQVAAELILNFKQISADHQSMELREFNLQEIIKNVIISFGIDFRNAGVTADLICKEDVIMRTYPGAVVHIVSNLIRNALVHGFEGREKGKIRIEVLDFSDSVTLIVTDDGVGMSSTTLNQIYDPFYTTKRSRGGTGLGLNIVHNMISNVLQGSITCTSELGRGTSFKVKMPKQLTKLYSELSWQQIL